MTIDQRVLAATSHGHRVAPLYRYCDSVHELIPNGFRGEGGSVIVRMSDNVVHDVFGLIRVTSTGFHNKRDDDRVISLRQLSVLIDLLLDVGFGRRKRFLVAVIEQFFFSVMCPIL